VNWKNIFLETRSVLNGGLDMWKSLTYSELEGTGNQLM
jgi:hypothetical protein